MASLFVFGSVNFAATDVAANEAATELGSSHEVQVAADGSRLVRTSTLGDGLEEFPNSGGAGRGDLFRGSTDYLWLDTNHNSAISEDVAISGDGAHGISGWWLNNMRTAFYEMDGDNVPEWTRPMPGIEFQIRVDAADSDRFTSTARNDSLYLFEAAGNTPVAS